MSRSTRTSAAGIAAPALVITIAAVAVIVAIAVAAFGVLGASPSASPSPVGSPAPASPSPSAPPASEAPEPTPFPTPVVTASPDAPVVTPGPDGVDGSVIPLHVFLGHDVTLAISDRDDLLVDAVSGDAADGMSVRWGDVIVRQVTSRTLELTWAGYPRDEVVTLVVKPDGDGILLRFGQEAPPANSDAMGADRMVVLTFAAPVSASDVTTDITSADD